MDKFGLKIILKMKFFSYYGESELSQNDSGWIHLDFYDDKKVKSILAMESAIYVLCESPEQKLFYHSDRPQIQRETYVFEDEDEDEDGGEDEINNSPSLEPSEDPYDPIEDELMSSKNNYKNGVHL